MKAKKTINKKEFERLSQEQQVKELKKMAKRANVRASLLEESGIVNKIYYEAEDYNLEQGRIKNRFYEGIKYKTAQEIKEAYTAVTNFLNNKLSTLGGIQKEVDNKVENLIKKGQFDYNTLKSMTEKEKTYVSKKASSIANKRLGELEKQGINYYAYSIAGHYNESEGRKNNRFYRGGKFDTEKNLDIHIQNVFAFLNSKSSTPQGVKDIHNDRLNKFKEKGVNIPKGKEKDFFEFLSSAQFKKMGAMEDSNQLIETYVDARNAGHDAEEINLEFQEYLNNDLSLDEVQERLGIAKWQQGGLLH